MIAKGWSFELLEFVLVLAECESKPRAFKMMVKQKKQTQFHWEDI